MLAERLTVRGVTPAPPFWEGADSVDFGSLRAPPAYVVRHRLYTGGRWMRVRLWDATHGVGDDGEQFARAPRVQVARAAEAVRP